MSNTPHTITENKLFYSIPIYQRLFEWDTDNIVTLLEDLKKAFELSDGKDDYYIGMLTLTKDNELVDGQQRFTVMMLLGSVLQVYDDEWKKFLIVDNKVRINFTARPLDNTYLGFLIDLDKEDFGKSQNDKMANGYLQIQQFMQDEEKFPLHDQKAFASYVYYHLSFFISNLPDGYSPRDLNKYFERMNTSGKNLEQHEILKVKLLSCLDGDIDKYMVLWNKISDVDTLLIRRRKDENLAENKRQALKASVAEIISNNLINGIQREEAENELSIAQISPSASAPKTEREINKDSRCSLSFPYLLLQVLYRQLDKKINCKINDFFKPSNLLSIFEEYLPFSGNGVNKEAIKTFLENLVRARLALDICFIRPTDYGYSLDLNQDEDNAALKELMMLQSMIFVSSSNYTHYRWFNWLMDEVEEYGMPNVEQFKASLLDIIDKEFPLPPYEDLTYNGDNRYWFWRLDFYIWQHRKELFDKDSPELNIVENYIFKRNRSIEHVAPQTPQTDSTMKWGDTSEDATLRDSFGNLVMISQGLNSALSNASYEIKTAHIQSYYNGSKSGTIESLKLLMIHKDYPSGWNKDTIIEHGKKMYEWLEKSCVKNNN
ncbi:DUF262 domain-containing protein [Prevotella corporis]|uniref:DUF262 domain-containing protein n=1 Tax=Prevotella corporis TaxID=28128 RepID=UPI0023659410|nr:DUF262 domain-containing HNH endonuclease family protein [Prevotella corporis]